MLIVNADDWGLRAEITDAIAECWRAGAIDCASAMVQMADSERSARLATELELPLGLHLNLTTPFTTAEVPAAMRERQARAVSYFAGPLRRRLFLDRRARARLDDCIADQLEAFATTFGGPPAHADGHEHVQVCPTVLTAPALRQLRTLREAQSFPAGGGAAGVKRAYRGALNRYLRRRFRSARFLSLRDLHPELGGAGLERVLGEAVNGEDIEIMVHPAWEDECRILLSPAWAEDLRRVPRGTHAELCQMDDGN